MQACSHAGICPAAAHSWSWGTDHGGLAGDHAGMRACGHGQTSLPVVHAVDDRHGGDARDSCTTQVETCLHACMAAWLSLLKLIGW